MAEFLGFLLTLGLIVFVLGRVMEWVWGVRKAEPQDTVFTRLAQNFGGRVVDGKEWHNHSLHFPYRESQVSLGYGQSINSPGCYWTHVTLDWPDKNICCEIRPQSQRGGMPSLLGTRKLLLGEPAFDADYYLAASDRWQLVNLLTTGVRDRLHELFWLRTSPRFSRQNMYVRVSGGQLFIAKPGMVTSEEVLREFIEMTLGFYNEALLTCVDGIQFLPGKRHSGHGESLGEETHCHVCGDPLAGHIIYCRGCQTPHHVDCWNYFGGCGTYGCGGKRYSLQSARARL